MTKGADALRADGYTGEVKILTSCPCLPARLEPLQRRCGTTTDYIVVEMARHLLGPELVERLCCQGK